MDFQKLKQLFNRVAAFLPPNMRPDEPFVFPEVPSRPVTPERAQEIFDQLAAMPDIAFGYANDGCYARAHIMCRRMFDMELTPKKSWAFEGDDEKLLVKMPDGRSAEWWYHVAAVLPVQLPNGKVEDMVIDPSLFDGPVTLQKWGRVMGAPPEKLSITRCGESPPHCFADYQPTSPTTTRTDERAAKRMQEYLGYQGKRKPAVFPSTFREFVLEAESARRIDKTKGDKPKTAAVSAPAALNR